MKKKLLSLTMALTLSAALLAGCGSAQDSAAKTSTEAAAEETTEEATEEASSEEVSGEAEEAASQEDAADPIDINIAALKGPTAMGMIKFMDDADNGALTDNNYNFTICAAADEITPKLIQGEYDIAAVPANLASVLYNNTEGGVEVLAINTLGVLYIVENGDSVQSVADLAGKTIYASGKGATPEYALNYILSSNGIDPEKDVTIEWKSEHAECLSALLADEDGIALLPQPFVTTAQTKSENLRVALDLTSEWDVLQKDSDSPSALITGVVIARKAFIEENPAAVKAFLSHYKDSVDYVLANTDDAAALIGKYEIVTEEVAKKALPSCNITYIDGAEMKEKLSGYLTVLMEQNAQAVGGTLPADDFYYGN